MGLPGYYGRFIRNFLRISYPITSLQRKGKEFEWTEGCEARFEQLKNLLTNASILNIVDLGKELVVCTYAFKKGLGGVMMQEGQVVFYESRKLTEHEHSGLRYLFDQPNLNATQSRWLDILSEFEFEIRYIKGKENRVTDALNRRVQVNQISVVISYRTIFQEQILHARQHDDMYQQLK